MKILVNCYACSPYMGSEPGMGWNFIRCLAKSNELHIITESAFKEDIDRYFSLNPEEKDLYRFYFIKRNHHNRLRIFWPPSYYWFYKKWQKKVYKFALQLHKKEKFDIVHQLNMVGYREPGFLWKIEGIPFIWGPIGGFNITPWKMLPSMGIYGTIFYGCRNIINLYQMHTMSRVYKAMKRADAIIAATQDCKEAIKRLYNKDAVIIPEVGLVKLGEITPKLRSKDETLRICWNGLHIPRKSLNLLIDAMKELKGQNIELDVIGYGSETTKWKKQAKKAGLENIVWHGWVERSKALEIMNNAHIFVITSLSDLTSTVILEALSYGLPVIALDHCGFSNVLNDKCGIKIKIENKRQVVRDLGKAIETINSNEELRRELSLGALERSKDFSWDEKARMLNSIYEQISKQRDVIYKSGNRVH